jgi:hypothetical protein
MKRKNIKRSGVLYSAYSDRGLAVRKEKRSYKKSTTTIPRSFLIALMAAPLAVQYCA